MPGLGGRGGGASLAIMVANSQVALDSNMLGSGLGGRGGNGGDGGPGGVGGKGGTASGGVFESAPSPCNDRSSGGGADGTKGGDGGPGGAAAGGSGGPSACIAFHGTEPISFGTNPCQLGKGGKGGKGGSNGTASTATEGALGQAIEKIELL
jgi:hypothetical protein